MNEEQLEIVDKNNNSIGEIKLRSLVHSTGLWHRTVHIYFFRRVNKDIEILVQLRAKTKDLSPNTWDTRFGGHIKAGEELEQAVVDEVKEEVGLDIEISDLIEGEWRKREKYPNNEFTKVYYLEFDNGLEKLKFNDREVQKVKWMSFSDIKQLMNEKPKEWNGKSDNFVKIIDFLKLKLF